MTPADATNPDWEPVQSRAPFTPESENCAMSDSTWFTEQHEHSGSSIGFRVKQQLHSEKTPFQTIEIYDTTDWGKLMVIDGCMMVKAGSVELLIWSPLAYQLEYKALEIMAPGDLPAIVGAAVAVERARPLQALLRANNVPFAIAEGDRVLVAPEQGGGLMIEFIPQN